MIRWRGGPACDPPRRGPAWHAAAIWLTLAGSALAALGAESTADPATDAIGAAGQTLRYRRVFLPSEAIRRLEAGAVRDEPFVPLPRQEFEGLLSTVAAKSAAPPIAAQPRIVQAAYTALLSGELLAGTARLTIAPGADPEADLVLEPCRTVLSRPQWQPATDDRPSAGRDPSDLRLGCDNTGRIIAAINAPGVLRLEWSLRGVKNAAGELTFDLALPTGAVNQLELTLHPDLRPFAEAAVVWPLGDPTDKAGERTWRLEFRGDEPLKIRVAPAAELPRAQPLVLYRVEQRYAVATDAVEIATRLRLDVHQQPLSEMTVQMDEGMHLYRAYYRDTLLDWSESKSDAGRRMTLAFPEPLTGAGHEIRLQALATAQVGTPWPLPRVWAPGGHWVEGVSRLEVFEPLRIADLEVDGGRQTQAARLSSPQRGEAVEIREFQPQPRVAVLLQADRGEIGVQTATLVKLGTTATTLVQDAQLSCNGAPRYRLDLGLLSGWTIDLVQSQPADALEDWRMVYGSGAGRQVQIDLRTPLATGRTLRLTVYAHRRGVQPGERLRGRDLRLGVWREATVSRSLMALAADPAHQIGLSGDMNLRRLAIEDLAAREQELVQGATGAVLYAEDAGADELTVALLEEAPSYSAEIRVDAAYREKWVEQTFRIRCQPTASKVGRLIVRFSEPMPAPLRWISDGDAQGVVLANPLRSADAAAADADFGSASWELILPRARDDAFEITAVHTAAFSGTGTVPLVSLPAAASQVGYVTVRAAAIPLNIEPQNVRPMPAEPPSPSSYSTTRGSYRYDPSLDCQLAVRMATGFSRAGAVWAKRAELSTRVLATGRAIHTVVYRLENRGTAQIAVEPPAGTELLEILVNGRSAFHPRHATTRAGVALDLPAGDRNPRISVSYLAPLPARGPLMAVTAQWPKLGVPVFERGWTVWLPPGWQAADGASAGAASWAERLFGSLLRETSRLRFQPLAWRWWLSPNAWGDRFDAPADAARRPSAAPSLSSASDRGWTVVQAPIRSGVGGRAVATDEARLYVMQHDFFRTAGWAMFLVVAGLTVWGTRRRPIWCLPITAAWGALALIVPGIGVPLLSNCFLGSLLAVAWVWFGAAKPRPPAPRASLAADSSRVALASIGAMMFLVVVLAAASATAQTAAQIRTDNDRIYQVLFPVDEEQQPSEPYVYVPRAFWNHLRREAAGGGTSARQWLILAADYRVTFDLDGAKSSLQIRELSAQYRLRTDRAAVRVLLPIRQDKIYLLPNRARLDGQPVSVAWDADGRLLAVDVPEPGEVNLELAFRPQAEQRDALVRCDVSIPRVPNAQLRLQLPNETAAVECPSARGTTTVESGGEQRIALGPADHLTLQWPADPAVVSAAAPVEAEQLMWLKFHPGAVVLEARFRFASPGGRLPEVGILASPELRLQPSRQPEQTPSISATEAGGNQRFRWKFQPPAVNEATLNLEFMLADASGVGLIRLPRLEAVATRTRRRWLGVSVDESLRYEPAADGDERIDPQAFATAWQPGTPAPEIAVSIPDGEPRWSLTTRPRETRVKVAQHLDASWGAERVDVQFRADLDVSGDGVFQHRLTLSDGLEIGEVSLREPAAARAVRWTRAADGALVVRWDQPISGPHRLEIQATRPTPRTGEQTAPRIAVQRAEIVADSLSLYRRAAVRLNMVDPSPWREAPDAGLGEYRPGWGRLAAALQAPRDSSPAPPMRVVIGSNRPRSRGIQVAVLERRQEAWAVQIQYDLQAVGGVVDSLRWEIPAEWTDSLRCDCEGALEVIPIPGQKRRQLILRPRQALTGAQRLTISGLLATPQGEAVQALDIVPLDVETADRYLCAPAQINQQGIAWKTTGLREIAELPDGFDPPSEPHKVFIATQPRFRASIADVQTESSRPRVVLADCEVVCAPDGAVAGTVAFDLQPSGIDHCDLELPENLQLIDVAFGGLPAMLDALEPGRYRLMFGPRQLTQQMQVVFQGQMIPGGPDGRRVVPVPRLVGIPVDQTLWTVRSSALTPLEIFPAQNRVDPVKLDFTRFANRARLIESASEAVAAADPNIAVRWYTGWFQQLADARSQIEHRLAADPDLGSRYAADLAAVNAARAELDERRKNLPPLADTDAAAPPQPKNRAATDNQQAAIVTGDENVEARFPSVADTDARQRGAAAALLAALAVVGALLLPHPPQPGWGSLVAPLFGLLVGVVWWCFFTPSVLGLIAAVLAAGIGLRRWLWPAFAPIPN